MDYFRYCNGTLFGDEVRLEDVAEEYGTPCYVYSRQTLEGHLDSMVAAFGALDPQIRFAVKALSNIHVLRVLAERGAGADVVSGGELHRALLAGITPERIVFAGVGKSRDELRMAIDARIGAVNVESEGELHLLAEVATQLGRVVHASVRVNPDVAGYNTPDKTTTGTRGGKFGIDIERVVDVYRLGAAMPFVELSGLHFHLGSPIYDPAPYRLALQRILGLVDDLRNEGMEVTSINIGGGFAAEYENHTALSWQAFADVIVPLLRPFVAAGGRVLLEPGRSIAANAGVLLTRVLYVKQAGDTAVAVVDAGMSHLLRPAIYDAFHFVWPVTPDTGLVPPLRTRHSDLAGLTSWDIAGPICESSDYLARRRPLPQLAPGETLAVFTVGAYGMTMSSHYNSVPRPPEVLLEGATARLVRRRETYADLWSAELAPEVLAKAGTTVRISAGALST